MSDSHKYDHILHLPHPVSSKHSPMTNYDRAAQFSPFAALTGFEDAIGEAGRLTDFQAELDEDEKALLNERLMELQSQISHQPPVTLTCFRPDDRKSGGAYVRVRGYLKKIDEYRRVLILSDGEEISIDQIYAIESGQ